MSSEPKHPTFARLLSVAEEAGYKGPTALAGALNMSEQVVNNWSRRGVSKAGALAAQEKLGCSSNWVLKETLPKMLTDEPPAQTLPLAETIKRFSCELLQVSAANRPLVAHAFKAWAENPGQWELLTQQLRNLGVDAGFATPDPRKIVELRDGDEIALAVTPEAMALAQSITELGENEVAFRIYDEMHRHLERLIIKYAQDATIFPLPTPQISQPPKSPLDPLPWAMRS